MIIKWDTGYMELSPDLFLDSNPSVKKCKDIANLAKLSDRDYGTESVKELQTFCNDFCLHFTKYMDTRRRNSAFVHRIEQFHKFLGDPLPQLKVKPKKLKSKSLFKI